MQAMTAMVQADADEFEAASGCGHQLQQYALSRDTAVSLGPLSRRLIFLSFHVLFSLLIRRKLSIAITVFCFALSNALRFSFCAVIVHELSMCFHLFSTKNGHEEVLLSFIPPFAILVDVMNQNMISAERTNKTFWRHIL